MLSSTEPPPAVASVSKAGDTARGAPMQLHLRQANLLEAGIQLWEAIHGGSVRLSQVAQVLARAYVGQRHRPSAPPDELVPLPLSSPSAACARITAQRRTGATWQQLRDSFPRDLHVAGHECWLRCVITAINTMGLGHSAPSTVCALHSGDCSEAQAAAVSLLRDDVRCFLLARATPIPELDWKRLTA